VVITPEFGSVIERETACCVHCRAHWIVEPGSGRTRGWCWKCAGPTCGSPDCDRCLPYEKLLDMIERRATRKLRLGV
jgi:hypothetical protein